MQRLNMDARERRNQRLSEELSMDKEVKHLIPYGEEQEIARVIWSALKSDLLELSKNGRLCYRVLASLDISKGNAIMVSYHEDTGNRYKSYLVGNSANTYKVLLALAWIMCDHGIELTPGNRLSSLDEHGWGIEFTRH